MLPCSLSADKTCRRGRWGDKPTKSPVHPTRRMNLNLSLVGCIPFVHCKLWDTYLNVWNQAIDFLVANTSLKNNYTLQRITIAAQELSTTVPHHFSTNIGWIITKPSEPAINFAQTSGCLECLAHEKHDPIETLSEMLQYPGLHTITEEFLRKYCVIG